MARLRRVRFEYHPGEPYPCVCTGWLNVGGFNVGDRFTKEVADVLIEAMRDDGIVVQVHAVEGSNET